MIIPNLTKSHRDKIDLSDHYFLHTLLFSELIEILNVLLDGVKSIWNSKGYNASLVLKNYKQFYEFWKNIDKLPEIQNLKIGEFKEFIYLDTEFSACIKRWELTRQGYWEDLQLLKQNNINPYPIPEDLEKLIEETEQILHVYQNQKEYLQELSDLNDVFVFYYLVFNYQNGTFLYHGEVKEFQPGISEFQLLKILLNKRERIITYNDIYKALNKKQISTLDPKDEIKQIRKNLRKQFLSLGINETETDFMLSKIVAKTNLGYILS